MLSVVLPIYLVLSLLLVQVMFGVGFPLAEQMTDVVPPLSRVTLVAATTSSGPSANVNSV